MWSDRETTSDCLGFDAYVESLASVCLERDIAPLTLGVFGSWGSGKTSLMKMLEAAVRGQEGVKTVWANAWRYEGKDEMQSALETIRKQGGEVLWGGERLAGEATPIADGRSARFSLARGTRNLHLVVPVLCVNLGLGIA